MKSVSVTAEHLNIRLSHLSGSADSLGKAYDLQFKQVMPTKPAVGLTAPRCITPWTSSVWKAWIMI